MSRKEILAKDESTSCYKMFLTVDEMSSISGIGQNFLRNLIDHHEIDYLEIGSKKLLTKEAVLQWYERNKVRASDHKPEVA